MIQDIQETDGAIYQCQVIISLTDKEIAEVPLIVRQPPVISDNSTRSVVATEGQASRLNILPFYRSCQLNCHTFWRSLESEPVGVRSSNLNQL